MNGKKAKLARRLAREEVANDPTKIQDGLIEQRRNGSSRLINAPFSVRSFTRKVKELYKKSQRGAA